MPVRIPVVGGAGPPEPPPYGGLGENGWARGRTFYEVVEAARSDVRREIEASFTATELTATARDFFTSYPSQVRVAAFARLEHIDSQRAVAHAERLFSCGERIWMRVFGADDCADLLRILTGAGAELPVLIFFGDDRREFARWGPRPRALQELEARQLDLDPGALERFRLGWYAQNRGREIANELRELLEPRLWGAAP